MRTRAVIGGILAVAVALTVVAFRRGIFHVSSAPPQATSTANAFWTQKLTEAQKKLQENPGSAFWHSQAAVAYDNLRDLKGFEREIHLATKLDSANPIYHYMAYAVYKRRDMKSPRDEALRKGLEADPENPFGHYEMGYLYEAQGDWNNALKEYKTVQKLLQRALYGKDGSAKKEYVDPRGNPFSLDIGSQSLADAIKRVSSHIEKH